MIRFLNIKKVITVTDFENSSFFVLFFSKRRVTPALVPVLWALRGKGVRGLTPDSKETPIKPIATKSGKIKQSLQDRKKGWKIEKDQRTTKNGKLIFIKLFTQFEARNYLKLTTQKIFFLIKEESRSS
jgi:hypothetical protein